MRFAIWQFPAAVLKKLNIRNIAHTMSDTKRFDKLAPYRRYIFTTSTKKYMLKTIFYVDFYNGAPHNSIQDVHQH